MFDRTLVKTVYVYPMTIKHMMKKYPAWPYYQG